MGLLDSLFNQSSYGGQGGGLLDFLRQSQMQQEQYQPSAGFPGQASPMNIGGYQMPRIGEQAQFMPQEDPAALPPNAQPAQGQMPMQPPQESPGGLGAGLSGFVNNLHTGPLGAIVGGIGSAAGMQSPAQKQANQTAQFLVTKGFDPALAKTIVSDPALLRSVLPQIMGVGGQTDDIKEYQFAKRENPSLTFEKFMAGKRATSGEYGMTPMFTYNEKTKQTEAWQLGKDGKPRKVELPEGSAIARGVEKIDTGTEIITINKQTGETISRTPKDIEGKESAEERGKAKGLAQVALPNVIANAEQTLQTIKSIKDDPYRQRGTGLSSVFNAIPATGGYDFAQKLEQLKGKTFLEAFQQLKGGGAITEIEGKKAESAIARLSAGQSEGAFLEAVNELEAIVTAGIERAKARAGQGGQAPQAPAAGGLPSGWSVKVR
jgi:hypothetical protein